MKLNIDTDLEDYLWHILYLRKGESKLADFILKYSPKILEYIPRTTWTIV
jgi:hypothetical protein